jgi:hypothetical protein
MGWGCYGIGGVRACNCDEEYCGDASCVSAGGTWTDGCNSCQCAETDPPVESPPTPPPQAQPTPTISPMGWGCYGIADVRACNCDEEYCGDASCVSAGGTWTDGCNSCQCAETDPPVESPPTPHPQAQPTPTVSPMGWGCYGIAGVRACNCDEEYCGDASCVSAGGTWSDGCKSCQCAETDPPVEAPLTGESSNTFEEQPEEEEEQGTQEQEVEQPEEEEEQETQEQEVEQEPQSVEEEEESTTPPGSRHLLSAPVLYLRG